MIEPNQVGRSKKGKKYSLYFALFLFNFGETNKQMSYFFNNSSIEPTFENIATAIGAETIREVFIEDDNGFKLYNKTSSGKRFYITKAGLSFPNLKAAHVFDSVEEAEEFAINNGYFINHTNS